VTRREKPIRWKLSADFDRRQRATPGVPRNAWKEPDPRKDRGKRKTRNGTKPAPGFNASVLLVLTFLFNFQLSFS
jgi:hypothetical protein